MASKKAMLRYRIIDEMLCSKSYPFPALEDLIEGINERFDELFEDAHASRRTVQKDLKDMRYSAELGFHAPIEYSTTHKGYFYDEEGYTIAKAPLKPEERQVIHMVAKMLSNYDSVPIFKSFKNVTQKIFDALNIHEGLSQQDELEEAIQFDSMHESSGNMWLGELTRAITQFKKVVITYKPFHPQQAYERHVHPYLLKEFKNRWYLIGYSEESAGVRTYGLDRISNMSVLRSNFPYNDQFDRSKYFKHSYGIYHPHDSEPQEVIISCSPLHGQYLKSSPIHGSQQVIAENKNEIQIKLHLYLSEDFIMEILSMTGKVKVLQPQELVLEIKKRLEQASDAYQ